MRALRAGRRSTRAPGKRSAATTPTGRRTRTIPRACYEALRTCHASSLAPRTVAGPATSRSSIAATRTHRSPRWTTSASSIQRRRVRLADRPVGLRQDDAAARHRRSRAGHLGRRARQRHELAEARLARAYGYVFQAPALFPWRTVLAQRRPAAGDQGMPRARRAPTALRAPRARRPRRASRASIRGSCRAACSSASRSRARSASSQAADDGRAVRRARRDHARPAERAAAAAVGARRRPSSSSPTRFPRRCSCRSASS